METVYPDDSEIKFRKKNYGDIEAILNDKVECTICNSDLLNEIISKKMIMVHRSHLFLCCCNCFFKLCEGNEYSCILCKSNKELSNCRNCNLNVCNRCVENHQINQVSNGILNKCFGCKPSVLWKQRAQAANVLKIFSSQLDMPHGLLVNEIEREQVVRKYLLKEAMIGQNSITNNIKDHMCLDFILNSYKLSVVKRLSEFSPNIDDTVPINERLSEFIQICEHVLEKTCSTLTDFKRIFNLSSRLNPGVTAIMKSLLKTEDENVIGSSRLNGVVEKTIVNNETNQLFNMCNKIGQNMNGDISKTKTTITSFSKSNAQPSNKILTAVEQFDDSVSSNKNTSVSSNVHSVIEEDEIAHPLDLFDDISSDEEGNTRKLRSRKVVKKNEEEKKRQAKNTTKNKILDDRSDDEKENDRLIRLNDIGKHSKKKVDEDGNINGVNENTSSKTSTVSSKNKVDKMEIIEQTVKNIDETDSGTDDSNSQNEEYPLQSLRDIFSDVINVTGIYEMDTEGSNDESDDSSLLEVIGSCLAKCNKRGIDHYRSKNQEKEMDLNGIESLESEIEKKESLEMSELSELSDKDDTSTVTCLKRPSPFRMPQISDDSDSNFKTEKKRNVTKRKLISSNSSNDSDSSSKFFKKTPKKRSKSNSSKRSFFSLTHSSSNSNSSSSDESTSVIVKKRRILKKPLTDESDEVCDDSSDNDSDDVHTPQKKGRKNIRKLKKKTDLSQLTISALKEEESRRKRIEERQKLYNQIYDLPRPMESCKKLVLDFDPETKKELVSVHPDLVKFFKPHQVEGVKFLWNSVFESVARIKEDKGSGSIVAHCMGLGKTLQVIALVHTLFRYPETGVKTVLVITPHATIENWCKEFHKWLNDIPEENNFYVLNFTESKTYESRNKLIKEWHRERGVLVTSYQLFRTVVNFKNIKKFPAVLEGLTDPGPDLVICDEGHILKNHFTATSKAVNRIKTLRRIVLTGTPLQNNLKEYHCMVDFIRPNLLGSIKDFTNRFINPITNGQYSDSTPLDVRLMKRRSHVLHRMLEGFVQRFDYSVLTPFLPPKHEYVIYLKMSDKQIELYRHYLENYRQPELFTNYHMLQMIWTHPKLLLLYSKRMETKREKQKFKEMEASFLDDDTSNSDSNSNSVEEVENEQNPVLEATRVSEMNLNWWKPLVPKKDLETVYPYSKFIMMFSILKECEEIGDKVLLFSQSLFTLDLIQEFLENAEDIEDDKGGPYGKSWNQGEDFFRIDGSVALKAREDCCERFNDVTNTKMRLLLLSTKAFNLGINLVGANRVIIFDVTWNPSLNVQSIFRVFRFGQNKPCYIYRLVSEGTMEQKIYERQISKLSMAFRVVDEHQIDRHFNAQDQEVLYEFEPNTSEPKSTLNLPKDRLMAELILKHKNLVMDILEHDSLLQNNEAEELDEHDRNAAWEDYLKEKEGLNRMEQDIQINNQYPPVINVPNILPTSSQTSYEDIALFNTLRRLFPQASMMQLNDMLTQVKQKQNVEQ